jgi:hypothetical protein
MSAAALSRTARLLQLDFFPALDEEEIIAALCSRRVQIRVSREAATSLAGQSAVAMTALLVSQLGAQVALEMEDVPLLRRQPPFPTKEGLRIALLEGSRSLIAPFSSGQHRIPDVDVRFGNLAPSKEAGRSMGALLDDWSCEIGPHVEGLCTGVLPFGATLAAVSIAGECLREAVVEIAAAHALRLPAQHYLGPPHRHRLALPPLALGKAPDLGAVDLVSAGAIANAALAVLLRVPALGAFVRVIDADLVELHNLNRCGLFTRASLGAPKVTELAAYGDERFVIHPFLGRLNSETLTALEPLAARLAVGVDHIPSRWFAQEADPQWLGVAGTSHFDVIASEHRSGMPCAGCLHPHDDDAPGPLPTISFVSALSGLLLAHRLLGVATGAPAVSPSYAWCLALHEPRGLTSIGLAANPRCPVGCAAAGRLARATHG